MNHDNGKLEVIIYEFNGNKDKKEVVLGINGSANRLTKYGWNKKYHLTLQGNPHEYLHEFFKENSDVLTMIGEKPPNKDRHYIGTSLKTGIQFTIPSLYEKAFIVICKAMEQQMQSYF